MTPETFLKEFGAIANAPGGVRRLREMILQLAVMGKLVAQNPEDEPASELLKRIEAEKKKRIQKKRIEKTRRTSKVQSIKPTVNLPKNWLWTKLENVFYNVSVPNSKKLLNKNINEHGSFKVVDQGKKYVAGYSNEQSKLIKIPGPVVIFGDHTKAIKFVDFDFIPGADGIKILRPVVVNEHYFYIVVKAYPIIDRGYGRHYNILINNYFPLPPLGEQNRIVAKVDQLMALCDRLEAQQQERATLVKHARISALGELANAQTGKALQASWKRVQDHLPMLFDHPDDVEDLKKCILQNAVMGKLVPQNPDDEPASELLKKIVKEKAALIKKGEIKKQKPLPEIREDEKPFKIPEGWMWCRLGTISLLITSGSRDWAKYYSDKGAKFLRMGNLSRNSFELRLDHIQHVTPPNNSEGNRTSLIANDLLISITGDVGMLGLIPNNFGEAYINQHTAVMRFSNYFEHLFIPYFCLSPFAQDQFSAPQRGIKNSFRLTDVAEMLIPLPPIKEQLRIVNKIKELFDFCDLLKNKIKKSRTIAEQLARSVVESITGQSTEKQEKMKAPKTELFPCLGWSKGPGQMSMRL